MGWVVAVCVFATQCYRAPVVKADSSTKTLASLECRRIKTPPVIDGKGDDAAWKDALTIKNWIVGWEEGRPAKTATAARLCWDDDSLYFFADLTDAETVVDRPVYETEFPPLRRLSDAAACRRVRRSTRATEMNHHSETILLLSFRT
ncbi:MAG: sugar-binding protein [Planctomycetia bacterium]